MSVDEDGNLAITLTGSDIDGDALTFVVASPPTNGALSGAAPNLTYTPNPDFSGSDSFTVVANDGTVDSAPATVSITVNDVNAAPVADSQSVLVNEDDNIAIVLSGNCQGNCRLDGFTQAA